MTEVRDWMGQGEHWEGGWRGLGLGEGHREVGAWVTVGILSKWKSACGRGSLFLILLDSKQNN